MSQETATTTAEITKGVLTAPVDTHIIVTASARDGMTTTRGTHIQIRGPELAGTTATQETRTITQAITVEGDRSIKDGHYRDPIL